MNFSINRKVTKLLSLILAVVMMTTLFAGCKKNDTPEDTSGSGLNLDLTGTSAPSETQTQPTETTAPVINENTATVTGTLNIRSSPSTEATIVGTLYAGDRIEVSRREVVTGIDWAYIIAPEAGWIMMEYVEMDIPSETIPNETNTPAGETKPEEDDDDKDQTTTNIKGVINANGLNIRSTPSTTEGKIQGSYNKGDVVTIVETKNGWGRTNKGWIKMDYVNTTGSSTTNNNKDDDKDTTNKVTITGNGSTTVQFRGIVTASELNVRSSASQTGDNIIGSFKYGKRVEFLEKSGTWGRTKDGWISLTYVYQDGTTGTKTGSGTVTGSQLNIRSGPGTGYTSVGSYNQGDRVTILEQFTYDNVTWGCTNKGWISMQYVQLDGADNNNTTNNNTQITSKTGTVTGSELNIRSGPGTNYGVVGSLNNGDRVTVLSTTVVDGVTWGNIDKGWVSMAYVKLD